MLKRIPVADLAVGMYIHELCGAWLDHPFWRSSFLIDNAGMRDRIIASGISEAWIDTRRGLDVAGGETVEEVRAAVEHELLESIEEVGPTRVDTEEEILRARLICNRAVREVSNLFRETRLGQAVRPASLLPVADEIATSVERNPGVLTALLRLRRQDSYTYMHSVSVGALMVGLGLQLGLPADQRSELGLAGLLHDIGKLGIELDLLNKKARLSDEEFEHLRRHAAYGHSLLVKGQASASALAVARHHHERADGSGYPDRLAGDAIPLAARMAAICDVYDATTSNRPYKDAWPPAYALRKMAEWSHSQYDKRVFHAFVRTVGIYPIGTLVRLKSDFLAVVIDQNEATLLRPRIKVFFTIASGQRIAPRIVDLAQDEDEIIGPEDPDVWGIRDIHTLWSGLSGPL